MTSIDASKFDDRLKKLGLPHDAFDRPGCSRLFAFHDYHGFAKLVQMPRLKKAEPSSLANLVSSYKNFNDVPTTDVITCVARSLAGLEEDIPNEFKQYIDERLRGAWCVRLHLAKNVIVTKDNPLIIDAGHALASFGRVTVEEGGYIEIRTNAVFSAQVMEGKSSEDVFRIFGTSGRDGTLGKAGVNGTNGQPGTPGHCSSCGISGAGGGVGSAGGNAGNGTVGGDGQNGQDGPTVKINIDDLLMDASLVLRGGNGGNGGNGGHGGNGGIGGDGGPYVQCTAEYTSGGDGGAGGNGGNGGDGGTGGNGGNGGSVVVHYKTSGKYQCVGNVLKALGGKGGNGGVVGSGGHGGRSGGDGAKAGNSGNAGSIAGRNGRDGSTGEGGTININPETE